MMFVNFMACAWLSNVSWSRNRSVSHHTEENPSLEQDKGFRGSVMKVFHVRMLSRISHILPVVSPQTEPFPSLESQPTPWRGIIGRILGTCWMLLVTVLVWSIACVVVLGPFVSQFPALALTKQVIHQFCSSMSA